MKTRLSLSIIILLAFGAMPLHAGEVSYSKTADNVVVSINVYYAALAEQDTTPALQIFGDGTVLVHEPIWKSRAGDWTMKLSQKELDSLLNNVADKGLFTANVLAAKKEVADAKAAKRSGGNIPAEASKRDTFVISTNVSSVKLNGAEKALSGNDLTETIQYTGLRADALLNKDAKAVNDLWAGTSQLLDLCNSPNLVKVN